MQGTSSKVEFSDSESYQAFLQKIMRQTRKHLFLIHDGARYHTSQSTKEFSTCAGDLKIFQALDTLVGSQLFRESP